MAKSLVLSAVKSLVRPLPLEREAKVFFISLFLILMQRGVRCRKPAYLKEYVFEKKGRSD